MIHTQPHLAVAAPLHDQRPVASAEQATEEFVPRVEAAGVNSHEPVHARNKVALRRLHHEMKMIFHETGLDLSGGFGGPLGVCFQEAPAIRVVPINRFAMVAPVHHMPGCSRIFHSELPGHPRILRC